MALTVDTTGASATVHRAIYNASASTGVDFGYLVNQARVESSFDAGAKAPTSSATGLYQFIEQSWLQVVAKHGDKHGLGWAASAIQQGSDGRFRVADPGMRAAILDLRRNPEASAVMAAEFASDNRDHLERRLGHPVEPVDMYLAHFLGAGGATRFLKGYEANPGAPAATVFPAAARSNARVFFKPDGTARSFAEVRARFATKFQGSVGTDATSPNEQQLRFADRSSGRPAPDLGRAPPTAQARIAYLMLASLGVSA